tara:strand:+ start:311 stop:1045 length:735 start_codon:yes stop_codon:yes gene_type:complete
MSLVSIIIPYFKKKKYIESTINSILNQKYQNFEIIIVYDDKDKSDLKILKSIKELDRRIKIIINKLNIGAGLSRNKAMKLAKGKYIAFIDADDLWMPNKLKKQVAFMEKNKINISHTSYTIINEQDLKTSFRKAQKLKFNDLIYSCDVGLSTVMIKKNLLIKDFFPNLKTKEDYVLWLKLSKKGYVFYPLKENLVSWRQTTQSLSSSLSQKLKDGYKVYRIYLKFSFVNSIYHLFLLSLNYLKK